MGGARQLTREHTAQGTQDKPYELTSNQTDNTCQ